MAFGESSRPCVHSAKVNGKSNYLRGGVCVFLDVFGPFLCVLVIWSA